MIILPLRGAAIPGRICEAVVRWLHVIGMDPALTTEYVQQHHFRAREPDG